MISLIDLQTVQLPLDLVESPKFRNRALTLLNSYGHGLDSPDSHSYYQTWFSHNIPESIYYRPLEDKLDNYGLAYFSPVEGESEADNLDRNKLVSLATSRQSPHWYAMAHTCWCQGTLGHMMAERLFPDHVWTIMDGSNHGGFVVTQTEDGNYLVFDLLFDDLHTFMELAGPVEDWVDKGDADQSYQDLIDGEMLWPPTSA